MNLEEKEVLTRIVKSVQADRHNFEALYHHSVKKVYYWCYTIVKDENLAKDLTQESMIKLYDKFHTLENPEAFSTWMYTLSRNICYNYIRDHQKGETLSLEVEQHIKEQVKDEAPDHLPQDSYDLQETKKLVVDLIRKLPRKQREVITLFYLAELKVTEISRILERDLGTIKSRLQRGRKSLEKEINAYEKKYGTKLYGTIVLPFLGAILQEDANQLYKKQDMKYDGKSFSSKNIFNTKLINGVLSLKPLTIGMSFLGIFILVSAVSFFAFNHEKGRPSLSSGKEVNAFEKSKNNAYIEEIDQSTFATRSYTKVVVYLKKSAENKKVFIEVEGKPVSFEQRGQKIYIKATENGTYTIKVGDEKKQFQVNEINPTAPELISVSNKGNYLEFEIVDRFNQIEYKASYVLYQEKKYPITEKHITSGQFSGAIKVYLYNHSGQYMCYTINLK